MTFTRQGHHKAGGDLKIPWTVGLLWETSSEKQALKGQPPKSYSRKKGQPGRGTGSNGNRWEGAGGGQCPAGLWLIRRTLSACLGRGEESRQREEHVPLKVTKQGQDRAEI